MRSHGSLPIGFAIFLVAALAPQTQASDGVAEPWVQQKVSPPGFDVFVKCPEEGDDNYRRCPIRAIDIRDHGTGARSQLLEFPGENVNAQTSPADSAVKVVDANFDGFVDLVFTAVQGMANRMDAFYLYHPKTKQFTFDDELSGLSSPEIDGKRKEIRTYDRESANHYISERYRYIAGKLTRVESVETCYGSSSSETDAVDTVTTTTTTLVHGKYVETVTKKPYR
jgi:hypothetical protein